MSVRTMPMSPKKPILPLYAKLSKSLHAQRKLRSLAKKNKKKKSSHLHSQASSRHVITRKDYVSFSRSPLLMRSAILEAVQIDTRAYVEHVLRTPTSLPFAHDESLQRNDKNVRFVGFGDRHTSCKSQILHTHTCMHSQSVSNSQTKRTRANMESKIMVCEMILDEFLYVFMYQF